MSTWVYIKTENELWTTGFYDPEGKFQTDADFDSKLRAATRCAWLNGDAGLKALGNFDRIMKLAERVDRIQARLDRPGDFVRGAGTYL